LPHRDIGARRSSDAADEDAWVEHVNDVSTVSLRSTCSFLVCRHQHSRPAARLHAYIGVSGLCAEMQRGHDDGFSGFVLQGGRGSNAPPRVRTPNAGVPIDIEGDFTGGGGGQARANGVKAVHVIGVAITTRRISDALLNRRRRTEIDSRTRSSMSP